MSLHGRRKDHICGLLRDLAVCLEDYLEYCEGDRLRVEFNVGPVSEQKVPKKAQSIMTQTLTDIQQFSVAIALEDVRGNPATAIAPPVWAASDSTILTVTAAADGMSAVVAAVGPIGTAQVTVTGDGGPTAGDDPFTGVLDVVVVSSEATQVAFTPAAPTDEVLTAKK